MDLAQIGARLGAELLDEQHPGAPVEVQGLRLPARTEQRQHQLAHQGLPQRVLPHQPHQLRHELGVPQQRQLRVEPQLHGLQPQFFEVAALHIAQRPRRDVRQRLLTPQGERLAQLGGGALQVSAFGQLRRAPAVGRELPKIALVLAEFEEVAGSPGEEPRGGVLAQRLPQAHHIGADGRGGTRRRGVVPDVLGDPVDRDHPVGVEEERRHDHALPRCRHVHLTRVQPDGKRAQQQEVQRGSPLHRTTGGQDCHQRLGWPCAGQRGPVVSRCIPRAQVLRSCRVYAARHRHGSRERPTPGTPAPRSDPRCAVRPDRCCRVGAEWIPWDCSRTAAFPPFADETAGIEPDMSDRVHSDAYLLIFRWTWQAVICRARDSPSAVDRSFPY